MLAKIKISIVDDHILFLNGVEAMLSGVDDFQIIGKFSNKQSFLDSLEIEKPDVLLLDLNLGVDSGFDIIQILKQNKINVRIIVLSMHNEITFIKKTYALGVDGYLVKNTDETILIEAIKEVILGKKYFKNEIAEKLLYQIQWQFSEEQLLTKKELEVLGLISKGFSTQEIADKLFISSRTVDTHRGNILKKMGVKNSTEAVKSAIEKGLI